MFYGVKKPKIVGNKEDAATTHLIMMNWMMMSIMGMKTLKLISQLLLQN